MTATWWQQLVVVAVGGSIGAVGRFVLAGWMTRAVGSAFPWGTLAVNLLGSLCAGFLLAWLEQRGPASAMWRAFLMVGVVGGFTTWSALVVETFLLQRSNGPSWSIAYLVASLAGSLLLLWVGLKIAEALRG